MSRASRIAGRGAGIVVAAAALSNSAGAAPSTPALDSVAEVALPALPAASAAPASIPAGERVDGLSFEQENQMTFSQPAPSRHVYVRATARQCLRGPTDALDSPDAAPTSVVSRMVSSAGVLPVRQERLVQSADGAAVLEVSDIWVDPRSMGARVLATARLPLTRLAAGPGAFAVYGLRVGGVLQIVVPSESLLLHRDEQGSFHTVECGHARVPLEGEPTSGASAVVVATPSLPFPPIPMADTGPRALVVTASLTRLSRDPAPVLSVTVAWSRQDLERLRSAMPVEEPGME